MDAEEARTLLKAEEKKRLESCQAEINEVLARRKCQLVGQPGITQDGRIAVNIVLVPIAET